MMNSWDKLREALQLTPLEGAAEALTKLNLILSWVKSDVPTPEGTRLEGALAALMTVSEEPCMNTSARHIVQAAIDIATKVSTENLPRAKALGSFANRVKA